MDKPTLRQHSTLDSLQRNIEAIPTSPSHWVKDLYKDIGPDGVAKCLSVIARARGNKEEASMLIGLFLDQTLTQAIKYMLTI